MADVLDRQTTGLLFFDPLNVYYKGADEQAPRPAPPVVGNYVRLAEAARSVGIPIFYAKAEPRPDGRDSAHLMSDTDHGLHPWDDPGKPHVASNSAARDAPAGSWATRIIDEIAPRPEDYVVAKHRWGAFHQTHLELSLRTRDVGTIILCGGSIDVGIVATACTARDLDLNLVIVRDACTGHDAQVFDMFMDRVFPRIARIRTTVQVVAMILAGAPASA